MARRSRPRTRLGRFIFGAPDSLDTLFGDDGVFHSERYDYERMLAEHHERPARQHAARELARLGRRLRHFLRDLPSARPGGGVWKLRWQLANDRKGFLPRRLRRRLVEHELNEARSLRYTSYYVHPIGETTEVEGYFDLPSGYFSLDVVTPRYLADIAEDRWDSGELGWVPHERAVVVPGDVLTPELVQEALTRWYIERYCWRRGHWSYCERRLPEIVVDLAWAEPEVPAEERVSAREALAEHNERMRRDHFRPFGREDDVVPEPVYRDVVRP